MNHCRPKPGPFTGLPGVEEGIEDVGLTVSPIPERVSVTDSMTYFPEEPKRMCKPPTS